MLWSISCTWSSVVTFTIYWYTKTDLNGCSTPLLNGLARTVALFCLCHSSIRSLPPGRSCALMSVSVRYTGGKHTGVRRISRPFLVMSVWSIYKAAAIQLKACFFFKPSSLYIWLLGDQVLVAVKGLGTGYKNTSLIPRLVGRAWERGYKNTSLIPGLVGRAWEQGYKNTAPLLASRVSLSVSTNSFICIISRMSGS